MVGMFNTTSGEVEELPFDLRPKRLMTYRLAAGDNKAEVRAKLVDALVAAIKQCLGDTEDEQIRRNSRIHRVLSEECCPSFGCLGQRLRSGTGSRTCLR